MKELVFATVMYVLAFCFVLGFIICMGTWANSEKRELLRRNLKAYDPQTGVLKWTDKAGGEDFRPEVAK